MTCRFVGVTDFPNGIFASRAGWIGGRARWPKVSPLRRRPVSLTAPQLGIYTVQYKPWSNRTCGGTATSEPWGPTMGCRLTDYVHWGPIISFRLTVYGHWGPILGLRLIVYGHWGPIIGLRLTDYGHLGSNNRFRLMEYGQWGPCKICQFQLPSFWPSFHINSYDSQSK